MRILPAMHYDATNAPIGLMLRRLNDRERARRPKRRTWRLQWDASREQGFVGVGVTWKTASDSFGIGITLGSLVLSMVSTTEVTHA